MHQQWLLLKGLLSTTAAVVMLGALLSGSALAAQPNVLMIVVDDMNDWVGCPGRASGCEDSQYRSAGSTWHAVCQCPLRCTRLQCVASRHAYRPTPRQYRYLRQQR